MKSIYSHAYGWLNAIKTKRCGITCSVYTHANAYRADSYEFNLTSLMLKFKTTQDRGVNVAEASYKMALSNLFLKLISLSLINVIKEFN